MAQVIAGSVPQSNEVQHSSADHVYRRTPHDVYIRPGMHQLVSDWDGRSRVKALKLKLIYRYLFAFVTNSDLLLWHVSLTLGLAHRLFRFSKEESYK